MTGNKEVITGSDFKRMVSGAYSEFLLEYEEINRLNGAGNLPGTHILRTMGAAVMPLHETKDDSIGGLARRVASGAVFGARGNAGVLLGQMFRGISKGLGGKLNATSSEFGKAFQYGVLYVQRTIPEEVDRPIVKLAKGVAKGAYHAVRANKPISEILEAAISAGEITLKKLEHEADDAGARILFAFLQGCLKGLDGNFVSPAVSLSLGLGSRLSGMPDPRNDEVRPYCIQFSVVGNKIQPNELEAYFKNYSSFVLVEPEERDVKVHLHTNHPGEVLEQAVGWGPIEKVHITNMSESHVLEAKETLLPVALFGVAENKVQARELQDMGITILATGSEEACPSVAELVSAAHSDLADTYVMVAWSRDFWLVFRQAKRLLGDRVELVLCEDKVQQAKAVRAFDAAKSAKENVLAMRAAAEINKN